MHQKVKNMIPTSDPRVTLIGHPAPAWLVNYADLMTELVCFFIILYALSAALNKDVQQAKKDVQEKMKAEKVSGDVKVSKDGMTITIEEKGENVLFESGSAEMTPKMEEILDKIGPTLKKLASDGHEIIVEGHTDDVPIHNGQFDSNWDLSTARATSVVRDLINEQKFPAKEMGAIGYGEFRPLVANDTEDHRATNRRVVFFVKNKPAKADAGAAKEPTTASVTVSDKSDADVQQPPANTEPTTDQSLPLPQEAPPDTPTDQTTTQ